MYIREWKCICPEVSEEGFISYLQETGVKETQVIDGCVGYKILHRTMESEVELTFITYWQSLESMKKYAGQNLYSAVLYPEDKIYHIRPELEVKVYKVIDSVEDR